MRVMGTGMALAEQVQVLARTDVLLGLPGSDLMNGVLMSDASLVIMPCRLFPGWQTRPERLWETESPEATLWLRHFNTLHLAEWCQHKQENVMHEPYVGVRLEAQDFVTIISDWMLLTRRPPRAWG
jgi:hypothetical protein